MKHYLGILVAITLVVSVGCDGCGSSGDDGEKQGEGPTAKQQVEQSGDQAKSQPKQREKPKEPPKPSEWSMTITGEDKTLEIGGPIVSAVERVDPSGTGDATLVIQMQPEPDDASQTAGRMIVRGFLGAKSKTGKLDVIRADVAIPSADLSCTDADAFEVFIDKYTEYQLEGSLEGTLACKDGKTYEISGDFRD